MKIGLNGQKILIQNPAGVELNAINLFKELAKIDKANEYVVYLPEEPLEKFWEEVSGKNKNFSYKVLPQSISWTHISLSRELLTNPVDIFYTSFHTMPIIRNPNQKVVSMIHGLEYAYWAKNESIIKQKIAHLPFKLVAENSDAIIVPSEATKNTILEQGWSVKPKSIEVISEGVNGKFHKRTNEEVLEIRKKYEIGEAPYFFFISTIQPRKNLPKTIEAFSNAVKSGEISEETTFVIAGKNGWLYEESLEAPLKYGVEQNVKFLGRVDEEDVPALLSGSSALLLCPVEEGFGLPLLEAMACRTPMIVSNIPPFVEVGEDFAIYVTPEDTESIKEGIIEMSTNGVAEDKIIKAEEKAKTLTWEQTARESLRVFENVVKNS